MRPLPSKALGELRQADLQPKELETDTNYGSVANVLAFEAAGTELVSPVRGPEAQPLAEGEHSLGEFKLDLAGAGPVVCPQGRPTTEVLCSKTGRIHARFSAEQCAGCPLQAYLPDAAKCGWFAVLGDKP